MPICMVKGCKNKSYRKSLEQLMFEETQTISFHALPKDPKKRQVWLNNLKLDEACVPKRAVVCSVHFKSKDFDRTSLSCTRLREHAIPYVQVVEDLATNNSEVHSESLSEAGLSSSQTMTSDWKAVQCTLEDHCYCSLKIPSDEICIKEEPLTSWLESSSESQSRHDKSVQATVSCVDTSTSVTPDMILFSTPLENELRAHIAMLKKKHQAEIKVLKQKERRAVQRVENLKRTVEELKKKNDPQKEQVEMLEGISDFNVDLLKRMKKKAGGQRMNRAYSSNLKSFALMLHCYSPRGYKYVREIFNGCLPHAKTLYKYTSKKSEDTESQITDT